MVSELYATEIDLPAPAEEVFRHLTDPAAMVRWMGQHATLRPVPGGAFEIDINGVPVRGHYLEIDPPRRVLVSWGVVGNPALPPGATQVEFTLTPTPAGTRLRLVHRGLPPDQAPMHATGWHHFLGRLALAAAGQDPGRDPWNQAPDLVRHAGRSGRAARSAGPHARAPAAARRSHPRCGRPPPRL